MTPSTNNLALNQKDFKQGKLRIFLGAAPGVGKTYSMLQAAHEAQEKNRDIVIGVVEAHGREDTLAMSEGLPRISLQTLKHDGHAFKEFDLHAAIERHPGIILVDELAHRNRPGALHPRRYQDIEDLLSRGIDVWTTLNIQHVESLRDDVETITGVKMYETVPDTLLDLADEIVLVDLYPQTLIDRLKEGKVYEEEQAQKALAGFFSLNNLTALRDLAVNLVADRADQEVRKTLGDTSLQTKATRVNILVAIDGEPSSESLIRAVRRIAERRQVPWTVLHVETGRGHEEKTRYIEHCFRLAERLGGKTRLLFGDSIVDEVLNYCRKTQVRTLVLGRHPKLLWRWSKMGGRLLREAPDIDLTFIATEKKLRPWIPYKSKVKKRDIAYASLGVAFAAILSFFISGWLPLANLSLIFLGAVLWVAIKTGLKPALFAAVFSTLVYNFFFTEPRYTFNIIHAEEFLTVMFFFLMALIGGQLAAKLRYQLIGLSLATEQTQKLLSFNRALAATSDEQSLQTDTVKKISRLLNMRVVWLGSRERDGEIKILADSAKQASPTIDSRLWAAASWSRQHKRISGSGTETLSALNWQCLPVIINNEVEAILAIELSPGLMMDAGLTSMLETLAHHTGQALQRVKLSQALTQSQMSEETERLRSALLSSISHDLRTPLSSIIGAASSLKTLENQLNQEDKAALYDSIYNEGERLNRYIQNLLDMTRLEHGGLNLQKQWTSFNEIVYASLKQTNHFLARERIDLQLPDPSPSVYVQPTLIEQVLVNLLENAAKFSPPDSKIDLKVSLCGQLLEILVSDQGTGIPDQDKQRVFNMFYTGQGSDRSAYGSGLGLAICHGMIKAHGGTIQIQDNVHGGTSVLIRLPIKEEAE
ncbi:sensor histidine kinase KdpD [Hydrogenovibrio sp. 3SP14C1]|uniref:sensor histidine kinase n=1 Tax=Hydrogenovibrio sp. 3SP14C1 TaxID=3038774 RepID=UPI002416CAF1|nr:sensor histidine kinase KdpD [Hydrogenovibrio sp. 3SP14C1]MDG4813262.1 sensor histidine kinase KdpD [Hydrogenovibrio sp. 3SP14C1]